MNQMLSLLKDVGLDIKTGIEFTGSEEKYLSAVRRFYLNYEKNSKRVMDFYAAKDYENYRITVHALKSNAKMIGATDLSRGFESLEAAARDQDSQTIDRKTDDTLASYKKLIDGLSSVGEMDGLQAAGEISAEEAKQTADELLAALDDFDDELSAKLVQKLSGYPFRITQKSKLKEAAELIDDFMYDDAADIIKEIYPAIE